jgi:hypothetical protein
LALINESASCRSIINNKRVLHFGPETCLARILSEDSLQYDTADFIRNDCTLKLDMSNMKQFDDASHDSVVAFDILEHIVDYKAALFEVLRVLSSSGVAVFTVPQKDISLETLEDDTIASSVDRQKLYGQRDHLRIFGSDFCSTLQEIGFDVSIVDHSSFPDLVKVNVLHPPHLSDKSLATNYRKVFLPPSDDTLFLRTSLLYFV